MCSHSIHDYGIWLGESAVLRAPKRVPDEWPFVGFLIASCGLPRLQCDDGRYVTIYVVQPIHQSELDLANQQGIEVRMKRLDAANVRETYDENRLPVMN